MKERIIHAVMYMIGVMCGVLTLNWLTSALGLL